MTPEQLKASILQYAIQGKLVEQRAEEGTGEELFQEIERKREVLIVAIISLFKSSKAQRLQNKVNELELKIKQNELDKIAKEKEDSVLACVEARFITVGKGKHRLKVWNSGNATAYNVKNPWVLGIGTTVIDGRSCP